METVHYKPIWNIKVIDPDGKETGWAVRAETAAEALHSIAVLEKGESDNGKA